MIQAFYTLNYSGLGIPGYLCFIQANKCHYNNKNNNNNNCIL